MNETTSMRRPKRWDIPFCRDLSSCQEMTDDDVAWILTQSPFSNLNANGFRRSLPLHDILKNDSRIRECEAGDLLVRQGDWGYSAFIVLEGTVRVDLGVGADSITQSLPDQVDRKKKGFFQSIAQLWNSNPEPEFRETAHSLSGKMSQNGGENRIFLQDVPVVLDRYQTASIEAGQWFGELAALGRTTRTATIFSEGKAKVLEIRWQGLRDIMRFDKDGRLKKYLEDDFREHALSAFLRNEPLFQNLTDSEMTRLILEVRFETYGEYDSPKPFKNMAKESQDTFFPQEPLIACEGEHQDGLTLIRSGIARVVKKEHHGFRTAGYLTPGHAFGLEELTQSIETGTQVSLKHSLRAIGYLNIIVVPVHLVREFLLEQPGFKTEIKSHKKLPSEQLINYLVDNSYVQGSSSMIIDLARCTRCDDCVRACAKTHDNNPRFIRQGPISGDYMFVNSCLHCADPVCMIECPTGAIRRDLTEGIIFINEPTCIGCSQCANNCPFDAIRMVQIRDQSGKFILDRSTSRPLMQATKCDLCFDSNQGPACQNACPHDALYRINLQDQDSLEGTLTS